MVTNVTSMDAPLAGHSTQSDSAISHLMSATIEARTRREGRRWGDYVRAAVTPQMAATSTRVKAIASKTQIERLLATGLPGTKTAFMRLRASTAEYGAMSGLPSIRAGRDVPALRSTGTRVMPAGIDHIGRTHEFG